MTTEKKTAKAAEDYIVNQTKHGKLTGMLYSNDIASAFKDGANWAFNEAFRWIPICEKLPPKDEPILIKKEVTGDIDAIRIHVDAPMKFYVLNKITHWRPINMKESVDVDFEDRLSDMLKSHGYLFPETDKQMDKFEKSMEWLPVPEEMETPDLNYKPGVNVKKAYKAGLKEAFRWHDVSEEVPDQYREVLLKSGDFVYVGHRVIDEQEGFFYWVDGRDDEITDVTHWRPIEQEDL
ncbi:MAG: hypothetical protein WC914_00170 [Proteiniphilum sp.]